MVETTAVSGGEERACKDGSCGKSNDGARRGSPAWLALFLPTVGDERNETGGFLDSFFPPVFFLFLFASIGGPHTSLHMRYCCVYRRTV